MRKTISLALLPLAVAAGAVAGLAAPAAAADPACKTVVTTLTARPDSGLHGDWAKDAITRTVTFCETTPAVTSASQTAEQAAALRSAYTATVVDTGTFTTLAGKSPVAGVTIPAGIKGNMSGGYTATFKAAPAFKNFKPALANAYDGANGPKTGRWVEEAWGGSDLVYLSNSLTDNKGWKWTYWTCSADVAKATEKWVNAAPDVNTGDITGNACPQPSTSAAPSASAPAGAGGGGTLPITGSQSVLYAGGAVVLLAAGAGLMLATRRRRTA